MIYLNAIEKQKLEQSHRTERDSRICDRIKAVLLKSEEWGSKAIAQALRIHEETVSQHLKDWELERKLKPENGGSASKLSEKETEEIKKYLEENLQTKVIDICTYVERKTGIFYTVSGMTQWLHGQNFVYKKPKATPWKHDPVAAKKFIRKYERLSKRNPIEEPILFMDSAHPTMGTKISHGWIKRGEDKPIQQTASRTRVNITGAIHLATMKVESSRPEFVNAQSTMAFLKQLKTAYPDAKRLHIILDQSGYHRSKAVRIFAKSLRIKLHYLPPYSPNLNPIERLWKVMNEQVRNNRFFSSAKEFRQSLETFFDHTLPQISASLTTRINDHFQTLVPAS